MTVSRALNNNKKDHASMPHPLDSLFAPESIALIGAPRDLEKIPGRLLSMLRKNEFPGKIYPINPQLRRYRRAEGQLPTPRSVRWSWLDLAASPRNYFGT